MTSKLLPLSAAVVAAALLGATAPAQTAQDSSSGQTAKPSPYQGVSTPPANDAIVTNDEPAAQSSVAPVNPAPSAPAPSPAQTAAPSTVSSSAPELTPRASAANTASANPDADIVTYVPGPANALPEGTIFRVRLQQNILASQVAPGTPFSAKLRQDLVHNGRIVVPMGSELRGKIVYATHGRRISGSSVIHLRADEFVLPDGTRYHLHAIVIDTQGSDTKATGEGNIAPKSHVKRELAEVAISTGGGALIGAAAGPTGAAVGSAVGAGVMGAHVLLAKQAVDLPQESTLVFSLTEPMFLTATRD